MFLPLYLQKVKLLYSSSDSSVYQYERTAMHIRIKYPFRYVRIKMHAA
jgi:hypothetical protein